VGRRVTTVALNLSFQLLPRNDLPVNEYNAVFAYAFPFLNLACNHSPVGLGFVLSEAPFEQLGLVLRFPNRSAAFSKLKVVESSLRRIEAVIVLHVFDESSIALKL